LFSGDGREGSTEIRQDAEIYSGNARAGAELVVLASEATPHAWLQVIDGEAEVLGERLSAGDGIAVEDAQGGFPITVSQDSKFLLFRLA
jgi:redox-sensitive bicupin YhaK (pirin superfamily)